jgi:hypothetical protein
MKLFLGRFVEIVSFLRKKEKEGFKNERFCVPEVRPLYANSAFS